jgi:S-disulfanyl-L-cysteine oxidoreductase SoxD
MRLLVAACLLSTSMVVSAEFAGVGRDATPSEVKAWDIDVRPDFTGLPQGSGSVADGEALWIAKCSSCHGDFGDANHVFTPLVGNTTQEDIQTGRVASLKAGGSVRTTFTKVATVSTLWDYIHRAMPWDAPRSLSPDQVYAVLAYLLNLAEIVPSDYVLNDRNIAQVQTRMPNRNGMTRDHGLWDIKGRPDTANTACMKDCAKDVGITSRLPDYALNAHGNLADQNRSFGAVRGRVTDPKAADKPTEKQTGASASGSAALAVLSSNGCLGCHGVDKKIIGPGFTEISDKHRSRSDARAYLADKIARGGSGVWGPVPMPPQPQLSKPDIDLLADWIVGRVQP